MPQTISTGDVLLEKVKQSVENIKSALQMEQQKSIYSDKEYYLFANLQLILKREFHYLENYKVI